MINHKNARAHTYTIVGSQSHSEEEEEKETANYRARAGLAGGVSVGGHPSRARNVEL